MSSIFLCQLFLSAASLSVQCFNWLRLESYKMHLPNFLVCSGWILLNFIYSQSNYFLVYQNLLMKSALKRLQQSNLICLFSVWTDHELGEPNKNWSTKFACHAFYTSPQLKKERMEKKGEKFSKFSLWRAPNCFLERRKEGRELQFEVVSGKCITIRILKPFSFAQNYNLTV